MPCFCYGSISGEEALDEFLQSEEGKKTMEHISKAAALIISHQLPIETFLNPIEFRQMFVKCFLHMMIGCDEKGKPETK